MKAGHARLMRNQTTTGRAYAILGLLSPAKPPLPLLSTKTPALTLPSSVLKKHFNSRIKNYVLGIPDYRHCAPALLTRLLRKKTKPGFPWAALFVRVIPYYLYYTQITVSHPRLNVSRRSRYYRKPLAPRLERHRKAHQRHRPADIHRRKSSQPEK